MLLARSRIETIPTTASPSITGRCRNPPNSIRLSASATGVSGSIVSGSSDIHFETAETLLERGKVLAMFFEGGVSPPGGYRDPKPGIGYVARHAGATVLPCHLSGTRGLYRPWTWPKIIVTYGPPLTFARDPDPTREANATAAAEIADAVKALVP